MPHNIPYLPREITERFLTYLSHKDSIQTYVSMYQNDTEEDIGRFEKSYHRKRFQHIINDFQIENNDSVGYELMKRIIPNYVTVMEVANYQWNLAFRGYEIVTNNDLWLMGPFTARIKNTNNKIQQLLLSTYPVPFLRTNLKVCMYFIIIDLTIYVIQYY